MQVKLVPIGSLSNYEGNPRIIDTYKFQTLVKSIKDFPEMLHARPLLIDEDNKVLCGNMRLRACIELEYTEVPVKIVKLTEEQKKELVVKDNLLYGDWDDKMIDENWDKAKFDEWHGYERFNANELDYEDLSSVLDSFSSGVKKAIQVDFGMNCEEAKEIIKECRTQNIYIGGVFITTFENIIL